MSNIIHIRFAENLGEGGSAELRGLLNRLRESMEMAEWKKRNRAARPTEDPSSWDDEEIIWLDWAYEMIGMPS